MPKKIIGIDIDSELILKARNNLLKSHKNAPFHNSVYFVKSNIIDDSFSNFTVRYNTILWYLFHSSNLLPTHEI